MMMISMGTLVKWMLVTCVVQEFLAAIVSAYYQDIELQNQLRLINKPSIKTFKTKYGEILDCIEIHKQLAFDHPLLRNHSIQTKPNREIVEDFAKSSTNRKILRGNIRCPEGTVLVKRIRKEDLLGVKSSSLLGTLFLTNGSSLNANQVAQGHELATLTLAMTSKIFGVYGNINVWGLDVAASQFSSGSVFVTSNDGSVQNNVAAGWFVNRAMYADNMTRLYTFWTKDSGKTTGCFNTWCPGFVQVSRELTPGAVLQPLSTYGGQQNDIQVLIKKDNVGNWWVDVGGNEIGYYPYELFTTLTSGADSVGWGGEIGSPVGQPLPPMGSGHFPQEGLQKACYITHMEFVDANGDLVFPSDDSIQKVETKPQCYQAKYGGSGGGDGKYMFFGGPPNCQV